MWLYLHNMPRLIAGGSLSPPELIVRTGVNHQRIRQNRGRRHCTAHTHTHTQRQRPGSQGRRMTKCSDKPRRDGESERQQRATRIRTKRVRAMYAHSHACKRGLRLRLYGAQLVTAKRYRRVAAAAELFQPCVKQLSGWSVEGVQLYIATAAAQPTPSRCSNRSCTCELAGLVTHSMRSESKRRTKRRETDRARLSVCPTAWRARDTWLATTPCARTRRKATRAQ